MRFAKKAFHGVHYRLVARSTEALAHRVGSSGNMIAGVRQRPLHPTPSAPPRVLADTVTMVYTCSRTAGACLGEADRVPQDKAVAMALLTSTPTADTPTEHLAGTVERVTFHSEETGFCV